MKKIEINLERFLKLPKDKQAKIVEEETKRVIQRLPQLKASLKMYDEKSNELYNLNRDELDLIGSTYSKAIRGGEISTPSSKRAYNSFVKNLIKYSRMPINILANLTAEQRMENWLNTIRNNSKNPKEIEYAEQLVASMSVEDKVGFTRSKYFLDNENWNSLETFLVDTDDGMYSIQVLKLELYLEEKGYKFDSVYMNKVASEDKESVKDLRPYSLQWQKDRKKK